MPTETNERDPRIDPQPGDSLTKKSTSGSTLTRTVTARKGNDIWYLGASARERNCWITTWQEWAKGAEIG